MAVKTRRQFLKAATAATGFSAVLLGSVKFDVNDGIRIGKQKISVGVPEAHALCGAGLGCSGGGGQCGAGLGCGGGGGQCGAGLGCSGGGGQCGAGLGCGGS